MKKLPTTVTSNWLEDHDACDEQVSIFMSEWPDGVNVTREALTRAVEIGMQIEWFAERILSRSAFQDYQAKVKPLDDDYQAKVNALYDDFQAKVNALYDDFQALYDDFQALYDDFQAKVKPLLIDIISEYYERNSHVDTN